MARLFKLNSLIPAALWLLLLASCGSTGQPPEPGAPIGDTSVPNAATSTPPGTPTDITLAGTQWLLTGYGPDAQPFAPPEGVQVTAEFTADQVQGIAACNSYSGSFTVDGQRLTIGELVQTEMACLREDAMELERTFLQALAAATTYVVDGNTLTIDYEGGVLRFTRSASATTLPLEGTPWQLSSFGTGDVVSSTIAGSRITATFAGGRVTGSNGCNSYSGRYTVQAAEISFGEMTTTEVACAEELMVQERTFLEALQTAQQASIEGRELRIEHAAGTLYFTAEQPGSETGTTTP